MPHCSASTSVDSLVPAGLDVFPGIHTSQQLRSDQTLSAPSVSAPDDCLQRIRDPLAPLSVGLSSTGLQWSPQATQAIQERATPKQPPRSLSQLFCLSGRLVGETLGMRDGDSVRRTKLEAILKLMGADYTEWSRGAKIDGTTRTFLIRCRGHLGKLEKLRAEHDFMRNPLGSKAAATQDCLEDSDKADEFLADVACAKKKVGEWITQAVLETDMCLRDDWASGLEQFREQYGTAQQQAAASQLGDFLLAMEEVKYLSERSKEELRQVIGELQELLNDR